MIHCLEIIETKQNIYIYIYDWIIEKYKRKIGYFWKIIHDYNYWKESKDLEPTNCR